VCTQCAHTHTHTHTLTHRTFIYTHLGGGNGLSGTVFEGRLPLDHRLDFIQDNHFVALALRHAA
jgi:hypothetical protein